MAVCFRGVLSSPFVSLRLPSSLSVSLRLLSAPLGLVSLRLHVSPILSLRLSLSH